jgi:hypothetical protein
MNFSRTMTVLLAAIIVIKSLNCVIGESLYGPSLSHSSVATWAMLDTTASQAEPLHPPAEDQGCTDSGCLCKGFVAVPEVTVPEPSQSLDYLFQLSAILIRGVAGAERSLSQVRLWRPGGVLFADTSPAGRTLRLWMDSFTI